MQDTTALEHFVNMQSYFSSFTENNFASYGRTKPS